MSASGTAAFSVPPRATSTPSSPRGMLNRIRSRSSSWSRMRPGFRWRTCRSVRSSGKSRRATEASEREKFWRWHGSASRFCRLRHRTCRRSLASGRPWRTRACRWPAEAPHGTRPGRRPGSTSGPARCRVATANPCRRGRLSLLPTWRVAQCWTTGRHSSARSPTSSTGGSSSYPRRWTWPSRSWQRPACRSLIGKPPWARCAGTGPPFGVLPKKTLAPPPRPW